MVSSLAGFLAGLDVLSPIERSSWDLAILLGFPVAIIVRRRGWQIRVGSDEKKVDALSDFLGLKNSNGDFYLLNY